MLVYGGNPYVPQSGLQTTKTRDIEVLTRYLRKDATYEFKVYLTDTRNGLCEFCKDPEAVVVDVHCRRHDGLEFWTIVCVEALACEYRVSVRT